VEELERRLGDPWDTANPAGFAAVLAADERAEMLAAGECILDGFGLNAEFVPAAYGGRLTRIDSLVDIMRAVYRRDPCLGLGYGASSLIAAANVWAAGDAAQCGAVARLLLANGRVAAAYHELDHGNDLAAVEFRARAEDGGYVLTGRKDVVTNAHRARSLVVFARTAEGKGRGHSLLLVDIEGLPAHQFRRDRRYHTAGMRGVPLGGVAFDDCPVPASAILGRPGHALETALRSFQLTRTALPGMAIGILDTALRTALRYAIERRLYGRPGADLPVIRSTLVNAFVDLLICDCFARVGARALHLLPEQASVVSAAVKYLVPGVLMAAMDQLADVLGARGYLREGREAIFQKLLRDVTPAGLGHVARSACLSAILLQLPWQARRGWPAADAALEALFAVERDLPPFDMGRWTLTAHGRDGLGAAVAPLSAAAAAEPALAGSVSRLTTELREIGHAAGRLTPADRTVMASPAAYALAARYAAVLAAAACLGVRQHSADPFLRDTIWLSAALRRLTHLGGGEPPPLAEPAQRALYDDMVRRLEAGRTFDLLGCRTALG
jgi:alkylation response protein AidB-like acyl-CoA dehydrogenase